MTTALLLERLQPSPPSDACPDSSLSAFRGCKLVSTRRWRGGGWGRETDPSLPDHSNPLSSRLRRSELTDGKVAICRPEGSVYSDALPRMSAMQDTEEQQRGTIAACVSVPSPHARSSQSLSCLPMTKRLCGDRVSFAVEALVALRLILVAELRMKNAELQVGKTSLCYYRLCSSSLILLCQTLSPGAVDAEQRQRQLFSKSEQRRYCTPSVRCCESCSLITCSVEQPGQRNACPAAAGNIVSFMGKKILTNFLLVASQRIEQLMAQVTDGRDASFAIVDERFRSGGVGKEKIRRQWPGSHLLLSAVWIELPTANPHASRIFEVVSERLRQQSRSTHSWPPRSSTSFISFLDAALNNRDALFGSETEQSAGEAPGQHNEPVCHPAASQVGDGFSQKNSTSTHPKGEEGWRIGRQGDRGGGRQGRGGRREGEEGREEGMTVFVSENLDMEQIQKFGQEVRRGLIYKKIS
eukprot:337737-Hanusia_phi.AAC.3